MTASNSNVRICRFKLKSASPYSASRQLLDMERGAREAHDVYDERTWQHKMHVNEAGNIIIPGVAFTSAILDAQQVDGAKIPGKRSATYAKLFEKTIRVFESLDTGQPLSAAICEKLSMNADGKRGSGSRVLRSFPKLEQWSGEIEVTVLDPSIPEEIVERAVQMAGSFIGVGRWRVQNRGNNGRFSVEGTPKWRNL
jgi:hypothetical protein